MTCYTTLAIAISIEKKKFRWLRLPLMVAIVIFNPIYPIDLARDSWQIIDLITALLILTSIYPALLPRDVDDPKPKPLPDMVQDIIMSVMTDIGWIFTTLPLTSLMIIIIGLVAASSDPNINIRLRPTFGILFALLLLDAHRARKDQAQRERALIQHLGNATEE